MEAAFRGKIANNYSVEFNAVNEDKFNLVKLKKELGITFAEK